jgi:hypothetical protein
MAEAYVMAGRRAEVEQWAAMLGEPYRLAVHAALGNKDRTFKELYRAAEIVPDRVVPLLSYPEMRLLRVKGSCNVDGVWVTDLDLSVSDTLYAFHSLMLRMVLNSLEE